MKNPLNLIKGESGQAPLVLVLLMVAVGGLLIPGLLAFASTSLKTTQIVEQRTLEFYSADAGVEDALWKIKNDQLPEWMKGDWGDATYAHDPYVYNLTPEVNNTQVQLTQVVLQPVWVLDGLEVPSPDQGKEPHASLATLSNTIGRTDEGNGIYQVGIIYDGSIGVLEVQRIGCWLPQGFDYVEGSSNLEDLTKEYYCEPVVSEYRNGTLITWEYPNLDYDKLPSSGSKKIVTFEFTPYGNTNCSFSWMRTNRSDIYLSWDIDIKYYGITAQATGYSGKYTTLEAYTYKKEFRKIGSCTEGDYWATGNTLMRDTGPDTYGKRDRVYNETAAVVSEIPADAKVEKIFLYWSGWKCKPWYAWNISSEQLKALPADKGVNKVALQVEAGGTQFPTPQVITASTSSVLANGNPGSQHGWSYSCYADITGLVTNLFGGGFVGNAKYTLGHWDTSSTYQGDWRYALYEWNNDHAEEGIVRYTRYPLGSPRDGGGRDSTSSPYYEDYGSQDEWAYAAWSVIIIYSSPSTKGHQLYIYDDFRYCDNNQTLDFTISGFLAPEEVSDDPEAARLTCFVGEGDNYWTGDSIKMINQNGIDSAYLSDATNPQTNVWNSRSNIFIGGVAVDGIDIDTYAVAGESGVIKPADSEVGLELATGTDSWNLVYIILSFRTEITTGGILSFNYTTGGP